MLVLPLRHPVELAKQAASIDVLSGGRLVLGVGAGWLAEEFEALDVPFASRGQRFIEWVQILRSCWTGEPEPFEGEFYQLPEGVFSLPAAAPRSTRPRRRPLPYSHLPGGNRRQRVARPPVSRGARLRRTP